MEPRDRYLATILFTDIVDSTRRAAELGDRRWHALLHEHDRLVRREIERHHGREINTAGDGFVVAFEDPETAVRCAGVLRDGVHALDLRIRCGLHAGEVRTVGDGIGGIAVHIAARVAALAAPDEVLVSRTVRDLLAGSDLRFSDRGAHDLKGVPGRWQVFAVLAEHPERPAGVRSSWIRRPRMRLAAAVFAAAFVGLLGVRAWSSRGPAAPAADAFASVAVLPFANASADPADAYFSDGLTEELISALAQVDGLRVPGRTSSFAFKDSAQDARRIGRALRVDHLLEGSVRRSDERLRIVARLVDADDGYEVWSETYDRTMADALDIQASIAQAIAGALELELLDPVATRATDPAAYDQYLKARYYSHAPTEDGLRRSIDHYHRAIRIDPEFAQAWAGLAIAHYFLGSRYGAGSARHMPSAKTAAERAVALDPELADSHLGLAIVRASWDRDYDGADRAFRRALELRPSYAEALNIYGSFLMFMHRPDEGIAYARRAISLEPLASTYAEDLGTRLFYARRYDEAIDQLRLVLDRNPDEPRPWLFLARSYEMTGRIDDALAAFDRAEGAPGLEVLKIVYRGHALAIAGRRDEAESLRQRAEALAPTGTVRQTDLAALELALGRREEALARLERAERERTVDPFPLQLDPRLDPLRSDPRFRGVVERMRLPEPPD